jgi:hypothetical protein
VGLGSGWIKIKGRERTFIFHLKANNGEKEKESKREPAPKCRYFSPGGTRKSHFIYIFFYVLVLQIKGKTN